MKKILLTAALAAAASSPFAAEEAITPELLTSQEWMSSTPVDESCEIPPLISFKKDGKFSGEPGCNDMMGEYQLGPDGKFLFTNIGVTRRMCAQKYMEMEAHFLDVLNNARTAKLIDGKIRFYDQDGKDIGGIEKEKTGACS